MIKITCSKCKEESLVNMYFYDSSIRVSDDPCTMSRSYAAFTRGKAFCPNCGIEIHHFYSEPITTDDIVNLALRREEQI